MLHLRVVDDDDPLTDSDAENLCTLYGLTGGQVPTDHAPEVIRGFSPGTILREHDAELDGMRRFLGIDPADRKRHRQPGQSQHRGGHVPLGQVGLPSRLAVPPRPSVTPRAVVPVHVRDAARCFPDMPLAQVRTVADIWQGFGLTSAQAVAWWEAGMPPDKNRVAWELSKRGVGPEHLGIIIGTKTLLDRVHEGALTPQQIADLLVRKGHQLRRAG